jgi:CubicO group peptidase (beta-lactamase class C family)
MKAIFLSAAVLAAMALIFTSAREKDQNLREIEYPGKEWKERSPKRAGVNEEALKGIGQIMEKAGANGALIRDGYLVAKWNYGGQEDTKYDVQSVTKAITGLIFGIALKDGKVSSVQDKVKDYYPAFNVGPYTNDIRFWHLLTATSGIPVTRTIDNYINPGGMPPGLQSRYHNDHSGEIAATLTYLYGGESLLDILRGRVLSKIGGEAEWGKDGNRTVTVNNKQVPYVAGYAYSKWSAKDLARVGWLYLNSGKWKSEQILPVDYVKQCRTPVKVPVMQFRLGADSSEVLPDAAYGFLWRGLYTKSGRLVWYMSGNGGQFCLLLPEERIVFTKVNSIDKDHQPFTRIQDFEEYILNLVNEI